MKQHLDGIYPIEAPRYTMAVVHPPKVCTVNGCETISSSLGYLHNPPAETIDAIEELIQAARADELKRVASHNNSVYTSDYIEGRLEALNNIGGKAENE